MLVVRHIIGSETAIVSPCRHHRRFESKIDKSFQDAGRAAKVPERARGIFGAADNSLTFAVITEFAGLQDGTGAPRPEAGDCVGFRFHIAEGRCR